MPELKKFYFSDYEDRAPEPPLSYSAGHIFLWQVLASATIILGGWYIWWRWTESLNYEALWFSVPVALAETLSYIGLLLYFHNLWSIDDTPKQDPPKTRSEVCDDGGKRKLSVDVFLPTYTEDPELTRYSIRDAKALRYPHPIDIRVHVLDDGNRKEMRRVAKEEAVNYITRDTNIGFKAGNLRNGMEQTDGDFIVILDSDTRPFPTLIENTLGYFKDKDVAWVQTPQWFYDIPEGERLKDRWGGVLGRPGYWLGASIETILGPIRLGQDPFISDPKLFYDVILRRRNGANASFCCGAGSVHRREAVMDGALKAYSRHVKELIDGYVHRETDPERREALEETLKREFAVRTELMPYRFHVSEDIYTSILLQSDKDSNWKSVLHPDVESKMLSPLDLKSWAMQRYKYAGGTLDIMFNDNPLFRKGMSVQQKLMYAMTFWSYLSPLWVVIFIAAPIIALFTGVAPVDAYSAEFFMHLLPFLIVHEIAVSVGTWGVDNRKGKMLNLAFFSFNLQALWAVVKGREIKFQVTPKTRDEENYIHLVAPQIIVICLTVIAFVWAAIRHSLDPDPTELASLVVNGFWGFLNAYAMTVLVSAALWKPRKTSLKLLDVKNRRKFRRMT